MSKIVYAPNTVDKDWEYDSGLEVFLAGSIEMGKAIDWQMVVGDHLSKNPNVENIFNPRRTDWDSSWIQSIDNPQFFEQVNWELDHLNRADMVFFYFDPSTKSPITLMELGYMVSKGYEIIVFCPDRFWRKGNVDVICDYHGILVYNNLVDAIEAANKMIDYLA